MSDTQLCRGRYAAAREAPHAAGVGVGVGQHELEAVLWRSLLIGPLTSDRAAHFFWFYSGAGRDTLVVMREILISSRGTPSSSALSASASTRSTVTS